VTGKVRRRLRPKSLPEGADREVGYAFGVQVGDTVWVSGQVAKNERNELVGADDPAAQAEQCFRNVAAILAEAGGTLADVVQLNIFIKDRSYSAPVQQVRKRLFEDPDYPTAIMIVGEAIRPEYLVEIQAVAVLG